MSGGFGSYVRVVSAYLSEPRRGFTIRRLASQCGGSYAWAHATCQALLQMGILRSQRVGQAVLCALNPESSLAMMLLALASAIRTTNTFKADPALAERARRTVALCSNPYVCILSTSDGFVVVDTGGGRMSVANGEPVRSVRPDELPTLMKQGALVVQGFEQIWRMALNAPRG